MKHTIKAIKFSLIYLTAFGAFMSSPQLQASTGKIYHVDGTDYSTPEDAAFAVFKPFFTDPNYQVTESFCSLCHKSIHFLEKPESQPESKKLAEALRKVCKEKNIKTIGQSLIQYQNTITQGFGQLVGKFTILARLQKAFTFK